MKCLSSLSALLLAAVLLVPVSAQAVPIQWTISGATFDDGGALSGSFIYDADTLTASNWNLTVTGGDTSTFPSVTYTPSNSDFGFGGTIAGHPIHEFIMPAQRFLALPFDPNLSNAGGPADIFVSPGNSMELSLSPFEVRNIVEGAANGVPLETVPTPGSLALLGTGMLGLVGYLRRRRPA